MRSTSGYLLMLPMIVEAFSVLDALARMRFCDRRIFGHALQQQPHFFHAETAFHLVVSAQFMASTAIGWSRDRS